MLFCKSLVITRNNYASYLVGGNDTDGYFVLYKPLAGDWQVFDYDWAANTATLRFSMPNANMPETSLYPTIDTERAAVLVSNGSGSSTSRAVYRTTDGNTYTRVAGNVASYASWQHNYFQHININRITRGFWDGNRDMAVVGTANELFPGAAGDSGGVVLFYAGTK